MNGWWDALGRPVDTPARDAAYQLLVREGYDQEKSAWLISFVARDMEHDNPDLAFRQVRTFLGPRNETLVVRVLATLVGHQPPSPQRIARLYTSLRGLTDG